MKAIQNIIKNRILSEEDINSLLRVSGYDQHLLFEWSAQVKKAHVGNKVYFRGLIEFSNCCARDCLYCGIRKSNKSAQRYNLSDVEIIEAACFALDHQYASIVIQSGEICNRYFTRRIERLLHKIHRKTNNMLRVTLSVGEHDKETYRRWFEAGAQRYLLRIETSNSNLYTRIHPNDGRHSFQKRLQALLNLKDIGYQTGTGVMIGLPFQTYEDLAADILFMRDINIDMVGMGPYIGHSATPLWEHRHLLLTPDERLDLTLRMIAVLRLVRPEINIAAATALQAIDKMGREKALKVGANVIMPNITPGPYRNNYKLYDNKPCTDENADDCTSCLTARIAMTGNETGLGEWGDSAFYRLRRVGEVGNI